MGGAVLPPQQDKAQVKNHDCHVSPGEIMAMSPSLHGGLGLRSRDSWGTTAAERDAMTGTDMGTLDEADDCEIKQRSSRRPAV
jgi:hypothetical protein